MANKPFDREVINVRERPFSSDINLSETYSDLALREVMKSVFASRTSAINPSPALPTTAEFIGEAFKVVPTSPSSMSVVVKKGLGFVGSLSQEFNINSPGVGSILGLNDPSSLKPIPLTQDTVLAIESVAPGNKRVDIIEVKADYVFTDSQSRDILNASTGAFDPTPVAKTFSWSLDNRFGTVVSPANSIQPLSIKRGIPVLLPSPEAIPQTTPGYTKIAEIRVSSFSTGVSQAQIKDTRKIAGAYGQVVVSGRAKLSQMTIEPVGSTTVAEILEVNAPPGIDVRITTRNATNRFYTITVVGDFSSAHANIQFVGAYTKTQDLILPLSDSEPTTVDEITFKIRKEWTPRLFSVEICPLDETANDPSVGELRDQLEDTNRTEPVLSVGFKQKVAAISFLAFADTTELGTTTTSVPPSDCIVNFTIVLG